MSGLLQCYNKGCGAKYAEEENNEDSCRYHPGEPVFHDVKKKWSCCKKYSTDFSEFLHIKGCTVGKHNNVRPEKSDKHEAVEVNEPLAAAPLPLDKSKEIERPSSTEPLQELAIEVSPKLKSAIDEILSNQSSKPTVNSPSEINDKGEITVGTNCKNSGCKKVYTNTSMDCELCLYHPGVAIFHEGMKYWSCCNQKTSEFESFMQQIGCTTGRHNWTIKDALSSNLALSVQTQETCRYDWFQLPGQITLTIYAKNIYPDTVRVNANQVLLNLVLCFDKEKKTFAHNFKLFGTINPKQSVVKLLPTKAEIILCKADPISWPRLECLSSIKSNNNETGDKQI